MSMRASATSLTTKAPRWAKWRAGSGSVREQVFAAGDHLNDLPMLSREYAALAGCAANAVEPVKAAVRRQDGFVSDRSHGDGVADGLSTLSGEGYRVKKFIGESARNHSF